MCGEKSRCWLDLEPPTGSPPRMRGKELECRCVRLPERITPAYAGKSHKVRLQAAGRWDHPRVCGEKIQHPKYTTDKGGSPPRMRGKERYHFAICEV